MPSSHLSSRRRFFQSVTTAGALLASGCLSHSGADAPHPEPQQDALSWDAVVGRHPVAPVLRRLFPMVGNPPLKPTGITRTDYLPMIAGIVDFIRGYQNAGSVTWKTHLS